MTYEDTLSQLYDLGRFGMKPGLTRIRAILKALSDPQDSLQIIHVAGTNGKGSTSAFLAAILDAAGHRVGLFTSPHLIAFPERIRINGTEIHKDHVVMLAERVRSVAPKDSTFFEIVTAMAYLHFAEQHVGPAVMEVGMGGRFDATNVAAGTLAVITPVALDHCEHLGNSIDSIATEKAGIIKPGQPVVLAPQSLEAAAVFRNRCMTTGSSLYENGADYSAHWEQGRLSYCGLSWNLTGLLPGIPGSYQSTNAATALCAAEVLNGRGLTVTSAAARHGLEQASWPGRMELFPGPPRILLDGAHNPAGAAALAESLTAVPRERLILLIGMVGDKDVAGILSRLAPLADRLLTVCPAVPRGLAAEALAARCQSLGYEATAAGTVINGLDSAGSIAAPNDLIVVCGSLFTVGEARARLVHNEFEPFRG
jgi:dihydrofolate synthase / folylpolyglutamate synthase